ncbi:MAG: hypothetical protein AAGH15_05185 [Myxococcota bacterium]
MNDLFGIPCSAQGARELERQAAEFISQTPDGAHLIGGGWKPMHAKVHADLADCVWVHTLRAFLGFVRGDE